MGKHNLDAAWLSHLARSYCPTHGALALQAFFLFLKHSSSFQLSVSTRSPYCLVFTLSDLGPNGSCFSFKSQLKSPPFWENSLDRPPHCHVLLVSHHRAQASIIFNCHLTVPSLFTYLLPTSHWKMVSMKAGTLSELLKPRNITIKTRTQEKVVCTHSHPRQIW